MQGGTQSDEILKLAIEQYEDIVRLDPKSMEDHLLLGRLYRLNNDLAKAENEFKTAVSCSRPPRTPLPRWPSSTTKRATLRARWTVLNAFPRHRVPPRSTPRWATPTSRTRTYKKAIEAYRSRSSWTTTIWTRSAGWPQNLLNDEQTDAALEQFKVIADADPAGRADLHAHQPKSTAASGRYDEAIETLNKASAAVPDSLEVKYNLAVIDEAQGQLRRRHQPS